MVLSRRLPRWSLCSVSLALISGVSASIIAIESAQAGGERLVVSVGTDTRMQLKSVSFSKLTGADSLGDDLSLGRAGAMFGIGIDSRDVTVSVEMGDGLGGLSGNAIRDHYGDAAMEYGRGTAVRVGLAAKLRRPAFGAGKWMWVGHLGLGWSRSRLSGGALGDAHADSLYMDLGGGLARGFHLAGTEWRVSAIAAARFHRVRSFFIPGLTERTANPDTPAVYYAPGVMFGIEALF